MPYKVCLVEDEIVTREGIRDNVDWKAHGFEFCGEAPDGEMALPLLQTVKPEVLITDIRMPFMDGLQLSQIVRDRLPATKIIILSGHDEFEYAQRAIKLGVSEYLLKPVSVQDLHNVLQRVASELERERGEQQALQRLREQVAENRAALRERLLLRLITGAASSAQAIEKSGLLGIDLVARFYLVVVIRVEPSDNSKQFDFPGYQWVQHLVAGLVDSNPDAFLLKKDVDELVLLLKGNSPENLCEERDLLIGRARHVVKPTGCELIVGSGTPQQHISDICRSFMAATDNLQAATNWHRGAFQDGFDKVELLKADSSGVEDFLRVGVAEDFDAFFETLVRPQGEKALGSAVVKAFIFTNIALATARFVDELGGDVAEMIPELDHLDAVLASLNTVERLRGRSHDVLLRALTFRDSQAANAYAAVILQAQECIEHRYMDPELSLNRVAAEVSLSACHFSTVFSQETGRTFKEYLTEIRLKKAKELLRTTPLKAAEIAYQVGYNDPHYFSRVFRKNTGLTPIAFRSQAQTK